MIVSIIRAVVTFANHETSIPENRGFSDFPQCPAAGRPQGNELYRNNLIVAITK